MQPARRCQERVWAEPGEPNVSRVVVDDLLEHVEFVRALDVPPDAVLCVKVGVRISDEQAKMLMAQIREVLPGRPVLVLTKDLDVIVVRDVPS